MGKLVIQIRARHGWNNEFIKSNEAIISVGRGLKNDVVLTDPYVAREQIRISRDDAQWVVSILDHTNPVNLNGKPLTEDSVVVNSGDKITIGRTHLTLLAEDHPLPETRKLMLSNWMIEGKLRLFAPVMLLAFVCLLQMLYQYQGVTSVVEWGRLISDAMMFGFAIVCWAGLWALVGRLLRHQPHFFEQLFYSALIIGALIMADSIHEYAEYMSNSITVGESVSWLFLLLVSTALLKYNLSYASNLRNTTLIALIFNASLMLFMYGVDNIGESDFSSSPEYSSVVKPPFSQVTGSSSVNDFLQSYEAQFNEFDN